MGGAWWLRGGVTFSLALTRGLVSGLYTLATGDIFRWRIRRELGGSLP